MQTRNEGTHVILPAGRVIAETAEPRSIACGALRHTDGKLRRDRSSAAFVQPKHPVAERGRLHGASELDERTRNRRPENRFAYYRTLEEERRWCIGVSKHS